MRTLIAVFCLAGCLSCASGESDLPPFSLRITREGKPATYLTGTQFSVDLDLCGAITGLCDRAGVTFYPAGNESFSAPLSLVLSATDLPVVDGRVTPGTYQFSDASPTDVFAQFNSHEGFWASLNGGKLIISTSTATRFAGSIIFTGVEFLQGLPSMKIEVQFDLPIPG